jgi:hypothetical protein
MSAAYRCRNKGNPKLVNSASKKKSETIISRLTVQQSVTPKMKI